MATRPPQAGSVIGNANSTGASEIARSADLSCLSLLRTEGERKRQAEAANSYLFDLSSENSSNPAHFFCGYHAESPRKPAFWCPWRASDSMRACAVHGLDGLPMDRGGLGYRAHSWRLCRPRRWSGDCGKRGDFLSNLPPQQTARAHLCKLRLPVRFLLEKQARLRVSLTRNPRGRSKPLHPKDLSSHTACLSN